jgi:hypothetical protein
VFVGHGVTFINDIYPRATAADGELQTEKDWKVEPTLVKKGASIGSGATILCQRHHRRRRHRRRRQRRHPRTCARTRSWGQPGEVPAADPETGGCEVSQLRFGVIGYGYWGPNIVRNL